MVLRTETPPVVTCVEKELNGYVGFANLPNQVFRKSVKRGFEFTLMVVGASGLGKSTLINSLFLSTIYEDDKYPVGDKLPKTVKVQDSTVYLVEGGVSLKLTLVDTPGFGDAINNTKCWQPILEYIDAKYEEYLNAEGHVNRSTVVDNRVHCCLYFISPGHGLKPLDIEFMKQLHEKVNIVPVIGKADTLTPEECIEFKANVMREIESNDIKIYQFPVEELDEEEEEETQDLQAQLPFAVVGSNTLLDINGKKLRGRMYPWGIAEVENPDHCDFIFLRNNLIRTHMQDLKDVTNNELYENFRCQKLAAVTSVNLDNKLASSNRNPLAQFEIEKKEHQERLKTMKAGMEKVMEEKVEEKMTKMETQKSELKQKHDHALKILEKLRQEVDAKKKEMLESQKALEELQLTSGVAVNNSTSSLNSTKDKISSKKTKSTKKLF